VVAPPYDVISDKDRLRYYQQDPHNVVRLISGEVLASDSAEDNKYVRAARFYKEWLGQGILQCEPTPTLHVYRHQFLDPATGEGRSRLGILGVVELEPFGEGILPHERTHARAKADRLSLTRAVRANLSPIFSLYEDPPHSIKPVLEATISQRPRLDIPGRPGERHVVWSITDPSSMRSIAEGLGRSRLYIADGHHRYETALNFRNKMQAEHPEAPPDAAFNFVLMLLVNVDDPGLIILPTHRVVHDVEGFDGRRFVQLLEQRYSVKRYESEPDLLSAMHEPVAAHRIGLAISPSSQKSPFDLSGEGPRGGLDFSAIDVPQHPEPDPVSALDVSILHREILGHALGIPAAAVEDEHFVSYSRDPDVVLERVASGAGQAAFLLRPTAVSDVVEVAKAGQVMPQKSTYFYPKPASGIVFNPLDPDIRIPPV
jgi:uncharacterized protein (DUF1015 family)